MKNLFESSAPKITFGGASAFGAEKATNPRPTPRPKPVQENSERSWMFDVINKYFDVIEEDEEESEGEEEDEEEIEEHEPVFATQVVARSVLTENLNPKNTFNGELTYKSSLDF